MAILIKKIIHTPIRRIEEVQFAQFTSCSKIRKSENYKVFHLFVDEFPKITAFVDIFS